MNRKEFVLALKWPVTLVLCFFFASLSYCNQSCEEGNTDRDRVEAERTKMCMEKFTEPLELGICTGSTTLSSYQGQLNYKEYLNTQRNKTE